MNRSISAVVKQRSRYYVPVCIVACGKRFSSQLKSVIFRCLIGFQITAGLSRLLRHPETGY